MWTVGLERTYDSAWGFKDCVLLGLTKDLTTLTIVFGIVPLEVLESMSPMHCIRLVKLGPSLHDLDASV